MLDTAVAEGRCVAMILAWADVKARPRMRSVDNRLFFRNAMGEHEPATIGAETFKHESCCMTDAVRGLAGRDPCEGLVKAV
jgi:hypothetical protein